MINLNHIGIAADRLPELKRLFSLMGFEVAHSEPVADQGVITHFIPLSGPLSGASPHQSVSLELLEVTDPAGTVAKFIQKRGPGVHHLSFLVGKGELDALCGKLRGAGYRMIYDTPRSGAHDMRINFIHPASAGGILIELMEPEA